MKIEYEIPDEKARYLSNKAKEELRDKCFENALFIIDEAARLEAGTRNGYALAEITGSYIHEAATTARRITPKKKKKAFWNIILIINYVSTLLTGIAYDAFKSNTSNSGLLLAFVLIIAVSLVTFTCQLRNND